MPQIVNMLSVAAATEVWSCFLAATGRQTSPWTIPANPGDNNPHQRFESSGTAKLSEKAKHAVRAWPRCDHGRNTKKTGREMRVWRNTHVRIESEPVAEWFLLEEFPRKRQMPPAHRRRMTWLDSGCKGVDFRSMLAFFVFKRQKRRA